MIGDAGGCNVRATSGAGGAHVAESTAGEIFRLPCPFPAQFQVVIYKMKAKKHYRRKNGHRQPLTKILITKVA